MLSSQMYKEAGIAGLLRASATAPVTTTSPLCVFYMCCFGLQFKDIRGELWRLQLWGHSVHFGKACLLYSYSSALQSSLLRCQAALAHWYLCNRFKATP